MGVGIDKTEFESMEECIAHFKKIWKVPEELDDSVFHCFIEDFLKNPEKYELSDEDKEKINFKKPPRPTFVKDPIVHEGKVEIYNTPEEIAEVQARTKYPEINPMDLLSAEVAEKLIAEREKNLISA
jgi:hypothetical protein